MVTTWVMKQLDDSVLIETDNPNNPETIAVLFYSMEYGKDHAVQHGHLIVAISETAAERDRLREQIDQLANFIMAEIPGEPSQSQGSVDTAIRIMTNQREVNAELLGIVKFVAESWCQMAVFCYEIGDIRAGSQGCSHVQARLLLARINGEHDPQPIYFREEVEPVPHDKTEGG